MRNYGILLFMSKKCGALTGWLYSQSASIAAHRGSSELSEAKFRSYIRGGGDRF